MQLKFASLGLVAAVLFSIVNASNTLGGGAHVEGFTTNTGSNNLNARSIANYHATKNAANGKVARRRGLTENGIFQKRENRRPRKSDSNIQPKRAPEDGFLGELLPFASGLPGGLKKRRNHYPRVQV
jgi:hypothetical protein